MKDLLVVNNRHAQQAARVLLTQYGVLKSDDHVGVISSARFARSGLAFILAAELRGILPEIIKEKYADVLK